MWPALDNHDGAVDKPSGDNSVRNIAEFSSTVEVKGQKKGSNKFHAKNKNVEDRVTAKCRKKYM
jgi:hypothetical protein